MTTGTLWRLVSALLIVVGAAGAAFDEHRTARLPERGTPIVFHTVERVRERAVIAAIVADNETDSRSRSYEAALARGGLKIAEIDINEDGAPEYLVMQTEARFCNQHGCATRLFWRFDEIWREWRSVMIRDGEAWGAKRSGFRDYVVFTGERREVFPFLEGREVRARPPESDEERVLMAHHLRREIGQDGDEDGTLEFWEKLIEDGKVAMAEADLNDDGVSERLVVVQDGVYCGSIGCQTIVLRKWGPSWRVVSNLSMFAGFFLLDEKKSGWHRIFTGEEIYTFRADGSWRETVEIDTSEIHRSGSP